MPNENKVSEIRRMATIRQIASDIFDKTEPKAILGLVADYEKLTGRKS